MSDKMYVRSEIFKKIADCCGSAIPGWSRSQSENNRIGQQVIDALRNVDDSPGEKLKWDFDYLDSLPDHSLDRVILFSVASHVANWSHFAAQIKRVLRTGVS